MKKIILIIFNIIFFTNLFAYDFYCVVENDARIRNDINDLNTTITSKFNNKKILVSTDEIKDMYILIKNLNDSYYINTEDLKLPNHQYVDRIFCNRKWLLLECVDSLFTNNPSLTYKYTGNIKNYIINNQDKMDFPENSWKNYVGPIILKKYQDIYGSIKIYSESLSAVTLRFIILSLDNFTVTILADINISNFEKDVIFNKIQINQVYKLTYKIDGDYLEVFYNDKKIFTFVNADDSLINEYTNFVKEKDYSLENIIWPHHADGTSEYEDTIRYPDPIVIEEPEEIEVTEYKEDDEEPEEQIPPFPDKKDPNYLKILKEFYPDDYSDLIFEKLQRRRKIKNVLIPTGIALLSIAVIVTVVLIILKKKKHPAK